MHAVWTVDFTGAELRVYRNALGAVRRCPGSSGCTVSAGGGRLAIPLDAPGEYRAVVFSHRPRGGGSTLEEDVESAQRRGDAVVLSTPIVAY